MAEGLKIENTHEAREFALARHVLRAVLAVLFGGVTVVLALQEVSVKTGVRWLLYLFLFVATDLIANAVIRRIAKQSGSR